MKNKKNYILIFCLALFYNCISQNTSSLAPKTTSIRGVLIDQDKNIPLPYAHILIVGQNKGATTNEKGYFSISDSILKDNDTISFQYVGYQSKKVLVGELRTNPQVFLKENIISLNEFFVFGNNHNPNEIIKNILKHKSTNYKNEYLKKQLFIRQRYTSEIANIGINFKRSSFAELDEKMTRLIRNKIPKNSISFTDFLGDAYFSNKLKDSLKLKVIKVVSLKDKNLADLDQLEKMFTKMFSNTKENEYWKIKSGIIGSKIDIEQKDTIAKTDSLVEYNKNRFPTKYYARRLDKRFKSLLEDKDKWDFLYKTNNYEFTLIGGTRINGEDVYIITFKPKKDGVFIGKLYVSIDTYALVKADYKFDKGKTGKNIQLFGVGYTENQMDISVFFEKKEANYELKFYAEKTGTRIKFDRNVSLLKKKKRFLIDKELNEIKVRLNLISKEESLVEMLVIDSKNIEQKNYNAYKQKGSFKVIYVDQFNDDVWKGYNIIEPTKQMRDYKKAE